jgi:hypothetical protein
MNSFLGLFGKEFLEMAKRKIKLDSELQEGIVSFLKIGRLRNELVHQNFASHNLELTLDEIYFMHQSALKCLPFLQKCFAEFSE